MLKNEALGSIREGKSRIAPAFWEATMGGRAGWRMEKKRKHYFLADEILRV